MKSTTANAYQVKFIFDNNFYMIMKIFLNYKLNLLFANILYTEYLKTKSRFFEDMDLVFSCMCCKLVTIESEH